MSTATMMRSERSRSNLPLPKAALVTLVLPRSCHAELIDRAMFRRFDVIVPFELPDEAQIAAMI
jgi:hypothetical protein